MTLPERFHERFWAWVDRRSSTECWPWIGPFVPSGYGCCQFVGKNYVAHRVAYELLVGPIPQGLQLDHLCRVRRCVNPSHLEPVTNRENTIRGIGPELARQRGLAVTHCRRAGHPYTSENTGRDHDGKRYCLACSRDSNRTGPPRRPRGPLRDVVDRTADGRCTLVCGHVVARSNKRAKRSRCGECENSLAPEVSVTT